MNIVPAISGYCLCYLFLLLISVGGYGANTKKHSRKVERVTTHLYAPTTLKFADVQEIALQNCATAGCHDGERMFSLAAREDFYNRKPRPLNAILRGSMPKDNPDFADSQDGFKLLEWLRGSQEE